jgi:8-oxo-dGTP pyrophosphatase MutT (NUDIX family)
MLTVSDMNNLRNLLIERLKEPLPGPEIWKHWMSRSDPHFQPPASAKKAGVLICLYQKNGEIYLPVMMRPSQSGPHSGQISLPGGGFEEDLDSSLINTALREAEEELGICSVDVAGTLSPLYIPVSGYLVQPVLGTVNHTPDFRPDPVEVERLIEVSINALKDPRNHGTYTFQHRGKTLRTPCFRLEGDIIWGATAMILAEFLHVYTQITSHKHPSSA